MFCHGQTDIVSSTAAALNADLVASIDVSTYAMATLQITGTFTGTLTFQGSNDGVNFVSIYASNISTTTAPVTTTTTGGVFTIPLCFKYLRVRMTAYTSGTATGTTAFSTMASEPMNMFTIATISGTPSVSLTAMPTPTAHNSNSAATTNATSVKTSAGTISALIVTNENATTDRYFKLYNKASAPTVGTDVPFLTFKIPSCAAGNVGMLNLDCGNLGIRLGTGIAYAITANAVYTDTTAVAAGEVKVAMAYV